MLVEFFLCGILLDAGVQDNTMSADNHGITEVQKSVLAPEDT